MDPTQNPNAGIPPVMQQGGAPIASAFSLILTKMFDQLMKQWLAQQQTAVQGQMGSVGGAAATQPVSLLGAAGGGAQ